MAGCFALRTDKGLEAVKAWCSKLSLTGWAVRELGAGAENEHWHWYLEDGKNRKLSALRVSLVREVPVLAGNGGYSLTVVKDVDKYLRYMAKGDGGSGPDVAWKYGLVWTDEKIAELHEEYWIENRKLKSRRTMGVMDYVIDACRRQNVKWDERQKIAEIYIRELAARSKPINTYAVKSAINGVQVQLCPDDAAIKLFAELV